MKRLVKSLVKRLLSALPALALAAALSGAAHAQAVQGLDGRWEGAITRPNGTPLTGVFNVATRDGKTTTTFDSPDQGAKDIPASVKREGDTVTFAVPLGGLTYTAKLSADGKTLTGNVAQGGGSMPLSMTRKAYSGPPKGPLVAGLDGNWEGAVETPLGTVRAVFHIASDGKTTTTLMDSPDQDVTGITAITTRTGANVVVEASGVGGRFEGQLAADGKSIPGVWTQGGQTFTLTLTKQ